MTITARYRDDVNPPGYEGDERMHEGHAYVLSESGWAHLEPCPGCRTPGVYEDGRLVVLEGDLVYVDYEYEGFDLMIGEVSLGDVVHDLETSSTDHRAGIHERKGRWRVTLERLG